MQSGRWPALLHYLVSGENHSSSNWGWHLKAEQDVFSDSTNKYIQAVSYKRWFGLWHYCSQVTVIIALHYLFTVLLYFMGPLVLRIIVGAQVSRDHTSLYCCLFVLISNFTTLRFTATCKLKAVFWYQKLVFFLRYICKFINYLRTNQYIYGWHDLLAYWCYENSIIIWKK